MKPQLISLSSYCPVKRPWDKEEIMYKIVNEEDAINHPYQRIEIPKLSYPKMSVNYITSHSFFAKITSEVNQIMP